MPRGKIQRIADLQEKITQLQKQIRALTAEIRAPLEYIKPKEESAKLPSAEDLQQWTDGDLIMVLQEHKKIGETTLLKMIIEECERRITLKLNLKLVPTLRELAESHIQKVVTIRMDGNNDLPPFVHIF